MFWCREKNRLERIANEKATERLNERIEQEKKDQRDKVHFNIQENILYRKLFLKMYTNQFPITHCVYCGSPAEVITKMEDVNPLQEHCRCINYATHCMEDNPYYRPNYAILYKIKCSNPCCVICPEIQYYCHTIEKAIEKWETKPVNEETKA